MKRIGCLFLIFVLLLVGCGRPALTWQEQYDLGVRYLSEGNYEEAILAFNAAIEIDPLKPEAFVGRADAYINVADAKYDLAELDYLTALKLDGSVAEVYLKLAQLYSYMENDEAVRSILEYGFKATADEEIQEKIELREPEMSEGSLTLIAPAYGVVVDTAEAFCDEIQAIYELLEKKYPDVTLELAYDTALWFDESHTVYFEDDTQKNVPYAGLYSFPENALDVATIRESMGESMELVGFFTYSPNHKQVVGPVFDEEGHPVFTFNPYSYTFELADYHYVD